MNHDILQRYIEGDLNQQEKEEVVKWLDADENNMQEFLLLRNIYDATLWSKQNDTEKIKLEIRSEQNKYNRNRRVKILREFLKIASIFILAVCSYHLFLYTKLHITNSNLALQTVYAPEGQRAEVVLSDGTRVWLNAKSSITFPNEFADKNRIVELDGEAYFDVTHDQEKKFIVKTEDYQVMVHGTEFNVNAYKSTGNFEIALIKGSVEVFSNSTDESIILSPDNRVYKENNKLIVAAIESQDQFLWKKGILSFENQNVKELFEKLELYYDVNIEVRNKEILTYQYTGKFWTKDGVEHILRVLQLRHKFKYTKDNLNNIIIY